MSFGIVVHTPSSRRWVELLSEALPDADVWTIDECPSPGRVDAAFVWRPPSGVLGTFPNLRFIQSYGHGVDALLEDPLLPEVPIAKLVDPGLAAAMARYVVHAALHHALNIDLYADAQTDARWAPKPPLPIGGSPVAVLGMGVIGTTIADLASAAGFEVRGWSRSPRPASLIPHFFGDDGLTAAVDGAGVVVAVLPLTPETDGLLDEDVFSRFRGDDSLFVNVGRGRTVDEAALIAALEAGQVGRAVLDVVSTEPLPPDHPLWRHPKVTVTPHISGWTDPASASAFVVGNLERVMRGELPEGLVDRSLGY